MAILNWADIVEILFDDAKQTLLDRLDSVGYTATSWQEGDPAAACVELSAEIWNQVSKVGVFLKTMALNATSQGEALTNFSDSHYDNQRAAAVAAQRRITLACAATAGPHTINVGDLVLSHADGATYRNIDDGVTVYPATLPSGGSLAGLVFEAEIAGLAGSGKAPNTVTIIITTLAGVTVSSDIAERDGNDEEADPVLRARNKDKWALLTRFELIDDAVKFIALDATFGVTDVFVDSQNPRGAGTFDVYMAGDLTTASAGDITLAQTEIDKYAFGATATPKTCLVFGAPASPLSIVATIYYQGSYEPTDMQLATETALKEYIKGVPLGGFDFYPGPSNFVPVNDIDTELRDVQIGGQVVKKTVVITDINGGGKADMAVPAHGKVTPGTFAINYVRVTG